MRAFGIDVSRWQGDFDFTKAKAEGVTFVIIKGGGGDDGLYVDSQFERNYAKAKAQGLHVGCYWFSKATTAEKAKEEAAFFFSHCCSGKQFDLPVYMDVEHKSMLALDKKKLTDVILAWLTYMQSCNMESGVYSFLNGFRQHIDEQRLGSTPRWVASWSKTCSYQPLGIWQFGGETNLIRSNKIAGVVCDQDYMLVDYPSQIRAAGKNGFAAAETTPQEKEECQVKVPVLYKGWTGGYVRTLQILLNAYNGAGLTVDGVFGTATDKAVRAYQSSRKLAVDGIVGYSVVPLRAAFVAGILFALLSFCLLLHALYVYACDAAVSGWTTIMVCMSLFGGTQLIMLGIMGEYLGRIYTEVKNRPRYLVKNDGVEK